MSRSWNLLGLQERSSLWGPRLTQIGFSLADQALSVGGVFLANVALARVRTKEEYGTFALSYSLFTFLSGLHNASILEPYTVYGSGKYRGRFPEYLRLMLRSNLLFAALLMAALLLLCAALALFIPALASGTIVGLALTVGLLLTGTFVRRTFYAARRADLAAATSFIFFLVLMAGLGLTMKTGLLTGLTLFLLLGAAWLVASLTVIWLLRQPSSPVPFRQLQPRYWTEHWRYARWVVATAFVFQLTTQGYYWILAALLSAKEVAELRTMYLLVSPVDQGLAALSMLILPMLALRYSSQQVAGLMALWKWYALVAVLVTASFCLLVRTLGGAIMHWLYAGKFDDLASLLTTMAVLPLLMGLGHTMNDALKSLEKPNFVFCAYLCSGAVTLLCGLPLVSRFGLRGAVYGMLLSGAAYTITLGLGFASSIYGKSREVTSVLTAGK